MKYCSINGKQQTSLSISDRGLAYGDGLFTTAKIVGGAVVLVDKHVARLVDGCKRLRFQGPTAQHLREQLTEVAKPYNRAVLKVMITAGSGGRGYSRKGLDASATNIIIMISDFPEHYEVLAQQGITLGDSKQQIANTHMLSGLKHLNRLEQVLLRAELDERSEDDLIVSDSQGNVIEATSANFFYWVKDQLYTPELGTAGVDGIIRQKIIAHHPQIIVCKTTFATLEQAQSMFICNSLMGIIPVKSYNNRRLTIDAVIELQKQMKGLI